MIGILIGVAVSVAVSTLVWPEREGEALRVKLGKLLRAIADLARAGDTATQGAEQRGQIDTARLKCLSLLAANRETEARVALEPGRRQTVGWSDRDIAGWMAQMEEILFSSHWLQVTLLHSTPRLSESVAKALTVFCNSLAAQLEWTASHFDRTPTDDPGDSLTQALATLNSCHQDAEPNQGAWLDEIVSAANGLGERIGCLGRMTGKVVA
jgi:multidrug resistance protein MdtO